MNPHGMALACMSYSMACKLNKLVCSVFMAVWSLRGLTPIASVRHEA